MLTTALNPNTFSIQNKTYTVGQQVQLTESEQHEFDRIVELMNSTATQRTALMTALYNETEAFNEKLASQYYQYDQDMKSYSFYASKLMSDIVVRLGGLLPLRIVSEGSAKGVYVRALTQNEPVVITTDIAKLHSQYAKQIEDSLTIINSIISREIRPENKAKIKFKPQNWPLMGMPYVSTKTDGTVFPLNFAEDKTEFKWEKIEHTDLDSVIMHGLANVLNTPGRVEMLQNGMWPFPMVAVLVGNNETLVLNISEAQSDQQRTQTLAREVMRLGAKYLILYQFGLLNTNGSIIDMEQDGQKNQPTYGFTISIAMVGKDNKLLLGAKNWRVGVTQNKEVQLSIYGVFEDHLGLPDLKVREYVEQIFAQAHPPTEAAQAPKLELVK
jgi:hypothetical protein